MRFSFQGIIICIGFCFGVFTPVNAQAIRVQSGDHAGFTRLVLDIGIDREWDLNQQSTDRWELSLSPAVDSFDTSSSFDLIQRNRIVNLIAEQSLILEVDCDCDVSSFRHDSRFLVIDIADPDPAAQVSLEPTSVERDRAVNTLPDLTNVLTAPQILPVVTPTNPTISPTEPPNARLAEAAQIMAEQLARAAASGLLDVAENQPMALGDPTEVSNTLLEAQREMSDPEDIDTTPDSHVASVDTPDAPLPIRAETAFDTPVQLDFPLAPAAVPASCDGAPFNVADWSESEVFYDNLGALRRELYDARDVLTRDGTIALAQHYIRYGFGAEGSFWLRQLQDPPENLLHLAELVDGEPSAQFRPVEHPEACSEGELLWRYVGGAVEAQLTADDTASIQRAFGELPPNLRDNIGPRLALKMVEDGYAGTARNIRDILERGGRMSLSDLQMLDVSLGITLRNSPEEVRHNLAEAMRDDGGNPAAVLAHALRFDRRSGVLPTPARLVTADALIREAGSGVETDDLWQEALLGHAALGQIDEALNRLGDSNRGNAVRAAALTELIADRVRVNDTAALVVLAHTYGRDWRPQGSAAGRVQVQAVATLRAAELFEAAQILSDARQPLILPPPEQSPSTVANPATIAWQTNDWSRLAEVGSGAHAVIAARLVALDETPPVPLGAGVPPDLNILNESLSDSRALRSTITELLARPMLP